MIDTAQSVLKDPSVLNAVVFCIAALGGQVLHAVKKWSDGYDWVFSNPRRTIGAIVANIGGMAGFVATPGALSGMQLGTLIALGIFMGLSADSVINKSGQRPWTDEERAENAAKNGLPINDRVK